MAWVEARSYQAREERALSAALAKGSAAVPAGPAATAAAPESGPSAEPLDASLVGRLDVPRLALSVMVKEGDDPRTLKVAAGHVPGTGLPWQPRANVAIAGHRDTFFRKLRDIRTNDEVTLTTVRGTYRYRVDGLSVVQPDQVGVLTPGKDPRLTLITCYPFWWAGSAPQRYVVRATRVD